MGAFVDFIDAARGDPRIGITHIALYAALWRLWQEQGASEPVIIYSYTVMPLAKISSVSTYHKTIGELDSYGYISYLRSLNRKGSKVYLVKKEGRK